VRPGILVLGNNTLPPCTYMSLEASSGYICMCLGL
jgi:hypothetical protein